MRLAAALVLLLSSQAFADSVTCESGGITISDPVSCTLGPITSRLFSGPGSTSGNVFTAGIFAETDHDPLAATPGQTSSGSAFFEHGFFIPDSPPYDVFKIEVFIETDGRDRGSSNPLYAEVFMGPGTASHPPLHYNTADYFDNCHHLGCAFEVTVPALGFIEMTLIGRESFEAFDWSFPGFADSGALVMVSRFASDGVMPDPFTPEPATGGATAGALIAIVAAYSRRRRRTVAYS
jgi:hypothetical protein